MPKATSTKGRQLVHEFERAVVENHWTSGPHSGYKKSLRLLLSYITELETRCDSAKTRNVQSKKRV